jgi:DNA end-binding protein Ku
MATQWKPEQYHDTYTEQLRHLIEQKAEGAEPVAQDEPPSTGGEVVDLMAALEASLAQAKEAGRGRARPARAAGRSGTTRSRAKPTGGSAGRRRAASDPQPAAAKKAPAQAKAKKPARGSAASKSA